MIDLGTVRPGSTIRIPFSTFDKDDGSSITMTSFAVGDILVYKDGSTTERASTSGYTATTDFDAKTGKQVAIIDLADNTTAGFWAAGSEYLVAIDAVTVDAVTTGGWVARFRIGYANAILDTTIATLSSQTSFTLTVGPAEDDALNDQWCIIHDVASAVQVGKAIIADYTGSTKTVTLAAGTTFTAAATDNISIMGPMPMQATTAGRKLTVESDGMAHADAKEWLGATIATPTVAGVPEVDVTHLNGATAGLVNLVRWFDGTTGFATASNDFVISGSFSVGNFSSSGPVSFADDLVVTGVFDTGSVLVRSTTEFTGVVTASNASNNFSLGATPNAAIATAAWAAATRTLTAGTNIQLPSNGLANVTAWTVAITGNITGNLSGSVGSVTGAVGSVTGAVGSVTGNVGGNVVGSVASVTGAVGSVTAAVTITGDAATFATRGLTMIEVDGLVYRYTTNALEQAPAGGGGGGGTDWSADERTAIRSILGVPASGTTPDEPTVGVLATIRDKTNLITTGSVIITSPVNAAGDAIALFRGDDYKNASGRAVAFTGITNCPSLTGGTVLLKIGSSISQSGTVTAADACRFDLTSAQTAALARSSEPYEVQATLSNGDVTTIVTGTATITGQI